MKKSSQIIKALLPLLLLLFISSGAWAADSALKLVSKAEKETTVVKAGKKEVTLVAPSKTLPGDVIKYTNHYTNTGSKPAEDAVITNPVPKDVVYVDGSAFGEGAEITFSIDKGKSFDTPGNLFKTEKGKKRNARANEYTHIRWLLKSSIPPGKEGEVGFKVKIK